MTTIRDIADFVRIINEQPEWNDTIRGIMLGRELLELPQRFAEFVRVTEENNRLVAERLGRLETDVGSLKADMADVKTDVGSLKADMADVKTDVDSLKTDVGSLKADVAELKTDVGSLKADMADVKTDVGSLKTDVGSLKTNMADMKVWRGETTLRLDRIEGRLGNLEGAELERRVHGDIANVASRWLNLNRVRIMQSRIVARSPEFQDLIDDAAEQNLITYEQGDHLQETDIIVSARGRSDRQPVHLAIEVSRTIADHDITRASERARSLSTIFGTPAISVVVGGNISQPQQELAESLGVRAIILPRLVA